MITKGVDLSVYQQGVHYAQLRTDGFVFAYARAYDGLVADPSHDGHVGCCRAVGIAAGSYQYLEWSSDPVAQADKFLTTATIAELRPVVDVETLSAGKAVPPDAAQRTDAWCERVKRMCGIEPIVYASLYYWRAMCGQLPSLGGATGWDWWLADYCGPTHPIIGQPYVAHQYAGNVPLAGQPGLWDLDCVYDDNFDVLRVRS